MQIGYSSLANLARLRDGVCRERASSWDQSGGNRDYWLIRPSERRAIFDLSGAGCIKHIWITLEYLEAAYARKILLRMWWDGESQPSVEFPIGDFFGIGHGIVKNFWSLPLQMSPEDGRGFNCWFPMPFASAARIEATNESGSEALFFFYVDYEKYATLEAGYGRFHAQWRRQNPARGWGDDTRHMRYDRAYRDEVFSTPNLTGNNNYTILEAEGKGQYVGCHLDVDCFTSLKNHWWG